MMMRERAGRRCREDDGAGDQRSLRPPRRLPHARRRYVYVYVLARVSERASNGEEDNERDDRDRSSKNEVMAITLILVMKTHIQHHVSS